MVLGPRVSRGWTQKMAVAGGGPGWKREPPPRRSPLLLQMPLSSV